VTNSHTIFYLIFFFRTIYTRWTDPFGRHDKEAEYDRNVGV